MYKKILMLVLMISVTSTILLAKQESPIAVIIKTSGQVFLHRGETNKAVKHGTVLHSGDEIVSGQTSLAIVKFVDKGAIVKVFSNSILTINAKRNVSKLDKKLFAEIGNVLSEVKKGKGEYEVSTPTTVAAVKGTKFLVEVAESGLTMVSTFQGIVEVKNEYGSKNVDKGKTASVAHDKDPVVSQTQPSTIDPQVQEDLENNPVSPEESGENGIGVEPGEGESGDEGGDDEGESENTLEIEFEDENGEIKTMIIHY